MVIYDLIIVYVVILASDGGFAKIVTRSGFADEYLVIKRQLSVMHPIYKLLDPHMRFTLEIIARKSLLNTDGVIQQCFTPGCYCMETNIASYKHRRFDLEGLPADFITRYGSSRPESKTCTKASNRRLPICAGDTRALYGSVWFALRYSSQPQSGEDLEDHKRANSCVKKGFTQDPDEHLSLMLSLVDCSSSTICSQLKYNEDTREVVEDEQSTKEHAKVTTKRVKGRAKQMPAVKAYKVKTDIRKGQYHTDDDPYFIQSVVKRIVKSFHSDIQDFLKSTSIADVDDT
nr:linoleate 13S-lipoxygenase 3-1, chloroplastic [Tanacetum cinerariifolium]